MAAAPKSYENWEKHTEHDERWSAVDDFTTSHLHRSSPAYLSASLEHSRANGLPPIETYPSQGKSLAIQCRLIKAKHVLEVGTLGGYTCLAILSLNPDTHITTIELDPKHAQVAAENVKNAGFESQVEIITGAGVDILPKLLKEVETGKREKYDMVFIDADKQNSDKYFDYGVSMCKRGALVYVDNVVRKGNVASASEAEKDSRVEGSRRVIEAVGRDNRVEATVLQVHREIRNTLPK